VISDSTAMRGDATATGQWPSASTEPSPAERHSALQGRAGPKSLSYPAPPGRSGWARGKRAGVGDDAAPIAPPVPPARHPVRSDAAAAPLTVTEDDREQFQRMIGFGGAVHGVPAVVVHDRLGIRL
jgi:hypothetical protein